MRGNKRDRVLGTGALLTTKRVQSIGYQQQFIDEATSVSKMCIYTLLFSGKTVMAHYELSASTCVEDAS